MPRVLLSAASDQKHAVVPDRKARRENLLEVVEVYNRTAATDLRASGIAYNYRQVQPREFVGKGKVHYEFWTSSTQIGAELHIESANAKPLAEILSSLAGRTLPHAEVVLIWDGTFNAGGRLRALFPGDAPAAEVAAAMTDLIELTRGTVGERLAALK